MYIKTSTSQETERAFYFSPQMRLTPDHGSSFFCFLSPLLQSLLNCACARCLELISFHPHRTFLIQELFIHLTDQEMASEPSNSLAYTPHTASAKANMPSDTSTCYLLTLLSKNFSTIQSLKSPNLHTSFTICLPFPTGLLEQKVNIL